MTGGDFSGADRLYWLPTYTPSIKKVMDQQHSRLPNLLLTLTLGLCLAACSPQHPSPEGSGADWAHYLGHTSSSQYSSLDQITKENVTRLEVAWTYETGDSAEYQANNLVVDGVVYTPSPGHKLLAIDGASGELIWSFDPDPNSTSELGRSPGD